MKTRKLLHLFLFFLILLLLYACVSSGTEIDKAERLWEKQAISNYKIEVLTVNSIWHAQTQTITVQNNEVVDADAECNPAPFENGVCQANPFIAEDFTVPGLFANARAEFEATDSQYLTITFDPSYHFPSNISFNDPEILDEDWNWTVTYFEIIP